MHIAESRMDRKEYKRLWMAKKRDLQRMRQAAVADKMVYSSDSDNEIFPLPRCSGLNHSSTIANVSQLTASIRWAG